MDEEQDDTSEVLSDQAEEQEPTEETDERVYSQAELDELLQKAKDRSYADARRAMKPKRPAEKRREGRSDDVAKGFAQRDALDDALADVPVSAEKRSHMREQMRLADPDDPAEWAESFKRNFLTGPQQEKETSQTKEVPVRKPGDDPGPAQSLPPWDRPTDPFKWTDDEIDRLVAVKGQRGANRIIRQKAEAFARSMRIQMAPKRR